MAIPTHAAPDSIESDAQVFDAVVIGAGITGIYQLHRLREAGLDALILEAGSGVGGVWFWNRYPGARFDSESYSYGYLFDEALYDEWSWSEHFAGQPEIEEYLNHAVDHFGLRQHIRLGRSVSSAVFEDADSTWLITTEAGERYRARYVIAALGCLSAPIYPQVPGIEDYEGVSHHTGRWPLGEVDFAGKRVAVVGTGSSGVQVIPFIAAEAAKLTIFQRTPNWIAPLNNGPITAEEQAELKGAGVAGMRERVNTGAGGFIHAPIPKSALEVDEQERNAEFERLYNGPGLIKMVGNFKDVAVDPAANALMSEHVAAQVRRRVKDPEIAAKLIPTSHGYGVKRPPQDNGYLEVFNQDNVELVSLEEEPIERFTEQGLRTPERDLEFDVIIFATGFDFATGCYTRIDFEGLNGRTLKEHWSDGPRTHMGLLCDGFPNLFLVGGPHSTHGNMPRTTEILADTATRIVVHARSHRKTRVETDKAHEDTWTESIYKNTVTLLSKADNFFTGANVPGKARRFLSYPGATLPVFAERLLAETGPDCEELTFS